MSDELKEIINNEDLTKMMINYRDMIKSWINTVNFRLRESSFECPITLMNEAREVFNQIKLIQEYRSFIDYVSILQGTIDREIQEE